MQATPTPKHRKRRPQDVRQAALDRELALREALAQITALRIGPMQLLTELMFHHAADREEHRAGALTRYREFFASIERLSGMVLSGQAAAEQDPKIAALVHEVVGRDSARVAKIGDLLKEGRRLAAAMEQGPVAYREIADFGAFARGPLRETMNAAIAEMSNHLTQRRSDAITASAEAVGVIEETMESVSTVSARLRLIAVNASIEASRAGPSGRAFGVIAAEVQKLAGEIQDASGGARRKLDELQL